MTRSIARQLARKELYVSRWPVVGSLAGGLLSIAIAPFGTIPFYVGSVCFICVLVILNIFLVTSGVLQEKKDNVLVFLLSLPVSTTDYWLVKVASNLAIFFAPWLLLTGTALVVLDVTALPDGLIPFTLATAGYIASYYCVLLAVAVTTESFVWATTVIVAGNVSVNLFIPFIFRLPSAAHVLGGTAVWGPDIVTTLAAEAVVAAIALILAIGFQSRKRDFV